MWRCRRPAGLPATDLKVQRSLPAREVTVYLQTSEHHNAKRMTGVRAQITQRSEIHTAHKAYLRGGTFGHACITAKGRLQTTQQKVLSTVVG